MSDPFEEADGETEGHIANVQAHWYPSQDTWAEVLTQLTNMDEIGEHPAYDCAITESAGRYLEVTYNVTMMPSVQTVAELVGFGRAFCLVDAFSIKGNKVFLMLKTQAQMDASDAAMVSDALFMQGRAVGSLQEALDADKPLPGTGLLTFFQEQQKPAPEPKADAKPVLRGLAKTIYNIMREYTATWVKVDQLRAKAQKTLTSKQSERDRCFDKAMENLVGAEYLWMRAEGTEVSHVGPDESEA